MNEIVECTCCNDDCDCGCLFKCPARGAPSHASVMLKHTGAWSGVVTPKTGEWRPGSRDTEMEQLRTALAAATAERDAMRAVVEAATLVFDELDGYSVVRIDTKYLLEKALAAYAAKHGDKDGK